MSTPLKRIDDIVIYDLSEPDGKGGANPLFRIDSVYLYRREDAEETGKVMAARRRVSLWLQRGNDAAFLESHRKARPRREPVA